MENNLPQRSKKIIGEMMLQIKEMFKASKSPSGIEYEKVMYNNFSLLSVLTMEMRNLGV
jgi:hypothetical protein